MYSGSSQSISPSQSVYRKIELQSIQDCTYLYNLAQASLHTRFTRAFPATQASDQVRERVQLLLSQFLERTFQGVRLNCTANGIDLSPGPSVDVGTGADAQEGVQADAGEYEALDVKTAERIRDLERKKERLLVKLAEIRRGGRVDEISKRWKGEWESELERSREIHKHEHDDIDENGAVAHLELDLGPMRRWEQVSQTHQIGIRHLLALRSDMPATLGSLDETCKVVQELLLHDA